MNAGTEARRWGLEHPSIVPYGTYKARHDLITIATGNESQFNRLALSLDRKDWLTNKLFSTNASRVKNRILFVKELEKELGRRPASEWLIQMRLAGVPVSLVNSLECLFSSEQSKSMHMVLEAEHKTAGVVKLPGYPVKFPGYSDAYCTAPPTLGQDTHAVLKGILGYSEEKIHDLCINGVIKV